MLRGIWGDPERYVETYWSRFEGRYFAGDGCKIDDDGYLWLLGRVDDVMNVSGHRVSTTEVESALVDHPAVAEAAVVGANDAITGQAIVGYVILRGFGRRERDPRRGDPPARRHQDRPDGPTEAGDRRARPPQDPQRQDHATAAARRRRGSRPRRHHHPGRRRGGRRDPGRGAAMVERTDPEPATLPRPRQLAVARPTGSSPVRPSCSTWTGSCPTPRPVSTTSIARSATGRRSSRRAATTSSSTRWPACSTCSTTSSGSCCSPPVRVACGPRRSAGSSATSCGGTCWSCATGTTTASSRGSSGARVDELRDYGFDLRLAFEDDRRNVDMFHADGVPCVYIHSGYYD